MGAFLSCCFEDCGTSQRHTAPSHVSSSERFDRQSHHHQAQYNRQSPRQQDQVLHLEVNKTQTPSNATQKSSTQIRNVRSRSTSPGHRRGGRSVGRHGAIRHSSVPRNRFNYPDEPHFHLEPLKKIPISELSQCDSIPKWWLKNYNETDFDLQEITLNKSSYKYKEIANRFQTTVKNKLKIESIQRVENVYLWLMYQLKLQEISIMFGDNTKEREQFHGTPSKNVLSICSDNFNWRRHGDSTGSNWYGKGVSFSPLASYSSHYTDKNEGSGNKMFLAKVIVTNKCKGGRNMKLPPPGYDTTTNFKEKEFVKYDDHTFYPEYLITYSGKLEDRIQNMDIAPGIVHVNCKFKTIMGSCLSCCFESRETDNYNERMLSTRRQPCLRDEDIFAIPWSEPTVTTNRSQVRQNSQHQNRIANQQANSTARAAGRNALVHLRTNNNSTVQQNQHNTRDFSPNFYISPTIFNEPHFNLEPLKNISNSEMKMFIPKWWSKDHNEIGFELKELNRNDDSFIITSNRFQRSVKNNLEIESIHRVENMYLWLMYQLKLQEISAMFGAVKDSKHFHGTLSKNVYSIVSDNFNWRRHGDSTGSNWYGKGVSFSPLASYSSHYTDKNEGSGNKMFLAKVIVTNKCKGVKNMMLLPPGYDTTTNSEEKEFVKYDDHTYYPEYLITYSGKLENIQNRENLIAPVNHGQTTRNFEMNLNTVRNMRINGYHNQDNNPSSDRFHYYFH